MNLIDKLRGRNGAQSIIVPGAATSAIRDQPNADFLEAEVLELAKMAYETQGAKAFELPREHAAIHESGHAIVYTVSGVTVEEVEIYAVPQDRSCWAGWTRIADAKKWVVSPDTDPADDCAQIRYQVAGWTAEFLFLGKELRLASSLDEVVLAKSIANTVAWKTGANPTEVFLKNLAIVRGILQPNERVARAIAAKLSRGCRKKILGNSLRQILGEVQSPPKPGRAIKGNTSDVNRRC